jgi:hypothetical protein
MKSIKKLVLAAIVAAIPAFVEIDISVNFERSSCEPFALETELRLKH